MHKFAIAATGSFMAFAALISASDLHPTLPPRAIGSSYVADHGFDVGQRKEFAAGVAMARREAGPPELLELLRLEPVSFKVEEGEQPLVAHAGFAGMSGIAHLFGADDEPDSASRFRGASPDLMDRFRAWMKGTPITEAGAAVEARPTGKMSAKITQPGRRKDGGFGTQARCLAQAIYFEARSEPKKGRLAVAEVVLNRVKSKRYPDTVCAVVFQGSKQRHKCQFSFACDGKSDRAKNDEAWQDAKAIALAAIAKRNRAVTGSATHYHASYVKPRWARTMKRTIRIGKHIFYRGPRG